MKVPSTKIGKFDGKICFICGVYLLNNSNGDLAYLPVHTGRSVKAKPDKYFLFQCPNCEKIAHKRCWYDHGEKKIRKGWFGASERQLVCPSCNQPLSAKRKDLPKWNKGYQIPGHPDDELIELHTKEVLGWKAGSLFGKIGKAIDSFFVSVGLGSLSDSETSSIAKAASKIGKTIQDVAKKVFKLEIPLEERTIMDLTALECQHCGAPLPKPEIYDEAVVCRHCGTAHLLPT